MRPVLFESARPLAVHHPRAAAAALSWRPRRVALAALQRRTRYTRDHLYTAATVLFMAGVILVLLHWVGHVRVNSYGAMLMLGFVAGTLTAIAAGHPPRRARRAPARSGPDHPGGRRHRRAAGLCAASRRMPDRLFNVP